jgi:hypothetical protein
MVDTTMSRAPFLVATQGRRAGFEVWEKAGRAIELASSALAPVSQAFRITAAVVLVVLVVAAKLCSGGTLR